MAVHTILMPKLGQTVEVSTIIRWHKQVGEQVKKGEVLFEIETDKSNLEAESFYEGTLLKIIVPEGVEVPVQVPVAFVGDPGDPLPELPEPAAAAQPTPKAAPVAAAPAPTAKRPPDQPAAQAAASTPAPAPTPAPAAAPRRQAVSPRARRVARELVIHTDPIPGSGPQGRVIEADVRAYAAAQGYDQLKITPAAKNAAAEQGLDVLRLRGTGQGGRIVLEDIARAEEEQPRPMSRMRQVIAQRLTESFRDIPHFFVTVAADLTDLLALRQDLKARGQNLTVTDFIMEAVILALGEHRAVNSATDGRRTWWNSQVNLGLAVSLEQGLVVPVVRNAAELSLAELHAAAAALVAKARAGKLAPDEMQGGTFTISNMGMLDVDQFTAIINPGESAILAVASTRRRPVVRGGKIEMRELVNLTLSADHRIIDGAQAAAFVNAIKTNLEHVELWKRLTSS